MERTRTRCLGKISGTLSLLSLAACNMVVGLNKLSVEVISSDGGASSSTDPGADVAATPGVDGGSPAESDGATGMDAAVGECTTNAECTERATAAAIDAGVGDASDGGSPVSPAVCVKPEGRCVPLLSEDCDGVTGDYSNDDAIVLATLFSTKGTQAATNLPRQRSATLAAEEINAAGGIPAPTPQGNSRPMVMISCDESTDLMRVAKHLVTDLHVPAIVGPNTSQDTLDLSNKMTVARGTLMMTPTAVASSISDLLDEDLTWLMVPSDVQRAPLMMQQINDLEKKITADRGVDSVKLGIIFRNDALGAGTRTSLNSLILNDKPLSDPVNAGSAAGNVKIDGYDFKQADQDPIVAKYRDFAPDIVVLAGTAEIVTKIMTPLEQQWQNATHRPYYVVIDSVKVPELIAAVTASADLRRRVRGTGITPGARSSAVYGAFSLDYLSRYGTTPSASGMGPSYDATYAIAYALAATNGSAVSGGAIAKGLRKISGGAMSIEVGGQKVLAAFQKLASGETITGIGTFGPLEWDTNGAVVGGTIEMWCIGAPTATPAYQSSGLTFDVKSQTFAGAYTQCGP